jgi:hypothetical protein
MKKQKLFLDEQKKQLVKNYDLQQKEDQVNQKVVVKLFNPTGVGTWYLTELNEVDNVAYGLSVVHEKELGYVDLNELTAFKGHFGLGLERDSSFPMNKKTLEECKQLN